MKFFVLVCVFGLLVGLLSLTGCATGSWPGLRGNDSAQSDGSSRDDEAEIGDAREQKSASATDNFGDLRNNWPTSRLRTGKGTGWESEARDIEKNLGFN